MTDLIGQQLGNYRLIRLLGTGGYAEVYLGEHIHLKRQAAIKILHTIRKDEQKADFLIEAQRLVDLSHPSIIQVFDFAIEGDLPYLIMEYAPNGTLRTRHPKGSRLPLAIVVSYVKYIATPLQYLHDQKLVHRDVKPDNLLLGKNQEILLGDFGIAAIAHKTSSLSLQGMAGTPSYMAPEQSQGIPRVASDQYALGIVAYEWLCGTPPFQGSVMALGAQHLSTPPPSLRQRVPTIPPTVEQVILKALAKKPQHRFRTITEFAEALEEASQPTQIIPVISPFQQSQNPSSPPDTSTILPAEPVQNEKAVSREAIPPRSPQPLTQSPQHAGRAQGNALWKRKGLSELIKAIPLIVLTLIISITGFVIYRPPSQAGFTTPTPTVQPTQQNTLAIDTFNRSNQALWGTTRDGLHWDVSTNTDPLPFSIQDRTGRIAGGQGPLQALIGPSTDNVEVTVTGSINLFRAADQCLNSSVNLGIVLRWTDRDNWYKACIDGKQLAILKSVHGKPSVIGNPRPVSLSAGDEQTLRFSSFGTRLVAKVWSRNESEPPDWQSVATDDTFATGQFGISVLEQPNTVIRIAQFIAIKSTAESVA